MADWVKTLITIVASVLASSGFWAYLMSRRDKKDAKSQLLLGLGHDRIIHLCMKYLERGWVTSDEFEDLEKYLYSPYKAMGGNGTAQRLIQAVGALPIKHITYQQQAQQVNEELHQEGQPS